MLVRTARLHLACLVAVVASCTEPSSPPSQSTSALPELSPMPLRLAEVLTRENVKGSPMLDVEPAPTVGELAGIPTEVIFNEDFERFAPRKMGWRGNGAHVAPRPGGKGRALRYRGGSAHRYVLLLPVEGRSRYRIQRGLRTSDLKVDLRVMETRVRLAHPRERSHPADLARVLKGKFVSLKELVRVHHFAPPSQPDRWQLDTITIHTNPQTRSLVLMFDDAESVVAGKDLEVFLDDLRVEHLKPNREQQLALLKRTDLAPEADLNLGMVKHGQLLPPGDASKVKGPHQNNFDYRYGILAPTPTLLSFPVRLPPQARLSLSYGLHKASAPGDGARFVVRVRDGAQVHTLLDASVALDEASWRWFEADLDLSAFASRPVELELETLAAGSDGLALWGSPIIDVPRRPEDPPNVLLIAVDTLRADRLSSYGHHRPTTPHLDALAADGIRFDQAISASNWTTSAFASIFTGLMPSRHRVIHRARAIAPDLTTLAEVFHNAGWRTQGVAYKAYLYNMGFEQGFDAWFNQPRADITADDNLAHAMDFLERHGDRRFFMLFHLNDPHQPFNQPAPFDTKFTDPKAVKALGLQLPITIGTRGQVLGCRGCTDGNQVKESFKPVGRALYDGAVAFTDDRIGTLLSALRERGIYDDTLIAFVSDHGEVMWDRANYFGHGGVYLTDDLVRVPLLLKPHRGSPLAELRGKVVTAQVRTWDLFPTLTELVGLDTPEMEAQSLLPMVQAAEPQPRVAVSENVKQHVVSVRNGFHKYILDHRPGRAPRESLYDLTRDPGEQRNIARQAPDVLSELRRVALEHLVKNREGRYVLVVGQKGVEHYSVRVSTSSAPREIRSLFGLNISSNSARPEVTTFRGTAEDELVLLAQIDLVSDAAVEVTVTADGRAQRPAGGDAVAFVPYREGLVDDLLSQGPGAYVLAGPTHTPTFAAKTEVDGDQLATLKALGYVE